MSYASILITSYNRMEMLGESLASLYANTDYPYELIIHDDGSQPAMQQWLVKLLCDGWISELILNPPDWNRGQALAADRCYRLATGDYIVKMEGDEQYAPGWLGQAVKAMELFPEVGQLALQQFYYTAGQHTANEKVSYPEWNQFVLREFEREGVKVAVVWCSPGGQFMIRKGMYEQAGAWYRGIADQETIEFRLRVSPMMSLLACSHSSRYPPVTDKEAHWEKFKDTPWLAVLDPPVVSTHWGGGRSAIPRANKTLKNAPKLLRNETAVYKPLPRGAYFGPMKGWDNGASLPT